MRFESYGSGLVTSFTCTDNIPISLLWFISRQVARSPNATDKPSGGCMIAFHWGSLQLGLLRKSKLCGACFVTRPPEEKRCLIPFPLLTPFPLTPFPDHLFLTRSGQSLPGQPRAGLAPYLAVRRAHSGFGGLSVVECVGLSACTTASVWHEACPTHEGVTATGVQAGKYRSDLCRISFDERGRQCQ